MSTPFQVSRDQAVALHRNGHIDRAISAYVELLKQQPDSADLLGLLGVAKEQGGAPEEAERLLRLSLRDRTTVPLAYRNLNNLLGLLIESGRQEDAKAAAEAYLPSAWPSGQIPDAVEQDTIISLVRAIKDAGLGDLALATGLPHLSTMGEDVEFALSIAELQYEGGQKDEASRVLNRDFGVGEDLPNLHAARAALAHERGDLDACEQHSRYFVTSMPALLAEISPSQQFVLAVFNKGPQLITDFRSHHDHHYGNNFPSQLSNVLADRFRFISILTDSPNAIAALRDMPRPALALNNFVNAEQLMVGETLEHACALEDSLGIKVINHPRLAVQTTRQKNSERFADIPGIIFPKTLRYYNNEARSGEIIKDIENHYSYPVIIRTVFQQMGMGTWLVANRQELHVVLTRLGGIQFYAISYIQARHNNGYYRSLRAAFVNGRPLIIRADYSPTWNVRARRAPARQEFYREHLQLLQRANVMVLNPEAELGKGLFDKLDMIGRLIPLDIFGMDFDVTNEGNLLIFEANATMNLLSTSPDGLEYPQETEKSLCTIIEQYFLEYA